MYEGIKKAFGPSAIKTAPLKSAEGQITNDRSKQMKRWAEHYQELYLRETTGQHLRVPEHSPKWTSLMFHPPSTSSAKP